jgi:hypothetical protein
VVSPGCTGGPRFKLSRALFLQNISWAVGISVRSLERVKLVSMVVWGLSVRLVVAYQDSGGSHMSFGRLCSLT